MKLYVLYAGEITCTDRSQLDSNSNDQNEIELANPIFLIDHPKGKVMWDAGLSDHLIEVEEDIEAWIFKLRMKKTVLSQLEEIGVPPKSIDYFAFSHIHNDHTGNANYFKSAQLVMQEKEYHLAFQADPLPVNYKDYQELKDSKVTKLHGDYDLFGDGKIRFISTPGHTAGHQSLLLKLEKTGSILISGDIAYYKENYQNKGIPTFNSDKKESLASLDKVQRILDQENAQLWIQHDKAHFDSLSLSPKYYE
ncbi:N-acyl homoserine lactonase family protein [Flammeovirga sp. SubArs3]|uniref:N-acyl homoserine lactonase family protein n=1 Tax=Flammeovirga sp. SubArs3 TaxID=2995316 RepID=UPI00248CF90D|nr:N-acyl homoserine lactonase family protein [Flammeovirga sp. SubArs3]